MREAPDLNQTIVFSWYKLPEEIIDPLNTQAYRDQAKVLWQQAQNMAKFKSNEDQTVLYNELKDAFAVENSSALPLSASISDKQS